MKIDVTMTEAVFYRFTVFDILRRRKMWKSSVTFASILSVSAVICFIMNHVDGAVMLGTVLLTVALGVPLVYFGSFFLSLRKQIIDRGLKRPQYVYTLELTKKNKGIHVYNEKETVDYEWKQVYHAYRDTIATYLYLNPLRGYVLPHTSLENGEPDELWGIITAMVPKEKCTVL